MTLKTWTDIAKKDFERIGYMSLDDGKRNEWLLTISDGHICPSLEVMRTEQLGEPA